MNSLRIFIQPRHLFDQLNLFAGNHKASLIFQRFDSNKFPAGLYIQELSNNIAENYINGNFQVIYISFNRKPKNKLDWDFIERESPFLIELTGGRFIDNDLEQTTIRLLEKKSKITRQFLSLIKYFESQVKKGLYLNNHFYPEIVYHESLVLNETNLWVDLTEKKIRATKSILP